MISEVMKVCGLDCDAVCDVLEGYAGEGVDFSVEENCLDAKITMTSELDRKSFDAVKSKVYNAFSEQVYCAEDRQLNELAAQLLALNGKTLAVAESLVLFRKRQIILRVPLGAGADFRLLVALADVGIVFALPASDDAHEQKRAHRL